MEGYHKRKLPHIQCEGMLNFITFRTYDSIDEYIKRLSLSDINNKQKQYQIDQYLDNSQNGAYLHKEQIKIIKGILFEYDNVYYELYSFAIMPNHIHLLLLPKIKLSDILKQIKGKSAILLNNSLDKKGTFWAREYYDKVIRDENHLNIVMEYILNNPIKVNLDDSDIRVYSKYEN